MRRGRQRLLLSELKRNYKQKKERPETPLLSRVSLHAARIRLHHPVTGEPMTVEAEVPKDFGLALKNLRRFRALALPEPAALTPERSRPYDRPEGK